MEKVSGVTMHPLLQAFRDARNGKTMTQQHRLANMAILRKAIAGQGLVFNRPLEIAAENGIDSIAVSEMMSWWIGAGYVKNVTPKEPLKYRLSLEFCKLYGVPPDPYSVCTK